VKSAIRRLWLQSRERAKVLREHKYCCEKCSIKQSRAKGREVYIEVHHDPEIDWDGVVDLIFERVLNPPQYPLCKNCHRKIHNVEENNE
jgi:predicted HNH restriction endonuclease